MRSIAKLPEGHIRGSRRFLVNQGISERLEKQSRKAISSLENNLEKAASSLSRETKDLGGSPDLRDSKTLNNC
jgi:hypothetical protein